MLFNFLVVASGDPGPIHKSVEARTRYSCRRRLAGNECSGYFGGDWFSERVDDETFYRLVNPALNIVGFVLELVCDCLQSTLGECTSCYSILHTDILVSPQHPAAHGVLRLILELNGEEILRADPVSSQRRSFRASFAYPAVLSMWVFCTEVRRS